MRLDVVSYDLITVGRVSMDLFSQDIGVPFEAVSGFATSVGGSPTNIAIAAARQGLRPAAFTAVGADLVGDFVLHGLRQEGVETRFVQRKSGPRTPLALVAIEPPDRFPLSFYRDDPADIHLTVEDAATLPLDEVPAVLISGNAFSRGSCADAARYCVERAAAAAGTIFLDLDLRPTEWSDPLDYGRALRPLLASVDVVIGTEEEFFAALVDDPGDVATGQPVGDSDHDRLESLLGDMAEESGVTAIVKRGPRGVSILAAGERNDAVGFEVDAVNTVGAGDAFAAGLIASRLHSDGWQRSVRYANACGAIQVTRHGASAVFPTAAEVAAFLDTHGGH
jgi:5-dehydro-2-deoxygluconokinase